VKAVEVRHMTESQRHNALLNILSLRRTITVEKVINTFGISPATARRDINKLEEQGKLTKVRNGAEAKPQTRMFWSPINIHQTSNHDENSWNGTDPEMYGDNFENFAVLSATVKGMPLIYNGQESDLDKRLEFFEKDEIEWKNYKYADFYKMLLTLNTENEALWNGDFGGETIRVESPEGTYAFKRKKGDHEIWVAINNNSETSTISFPESNQDELNVYGVLDGISEFSSIELPANEWIIISTK